MRGYTAKVGLRKPSTWHAVVHQVRALWSSHDEAIASGDEMAAERIRGDINEALGIEREWRTLSERYPEHFPSRVRLSAPFCTRCTSPVCVCGVER